MCTTGPFNLSHTSLTSFDAREKLRNMKHTNPVFWEELNAGRPAEPVVGESVIEDDVVAEFERDGVVAALERDEDDSDLSCEVVVASTVTGSIPEGVCKKKGRFASAAAAESIDYEEEVENWAITIGVEEGSSRAAGKRTVKPNPKYSGVQFWQH